MSVLIHPTACSPKTIADIQLATGLRAVIGRTFGVLVNPNGTQPKMRKAKTIRAFAIPTDPFGGDAA